MSLLDDAMNDLALQANIHYRLHELLEQHGTVAVFEALATAAESACDVEPSWRDAADSARATARLAAAAEDRCSITLADAAGVVSEATNV
jgi:hypothetical protein